ncbi:DUF6615 family protein [Mesorhizobium sp. BHbsci]
MKAKPKRPPLKRISNLQPLFFPLSKILCPPTGEEGRRVPTPEGSLRAVTDAVDTATERFLAQWLEESPKHLADLPGSARNHKSGRCWYRSTAVGPRRSDREAVFR